MDIDERRERRRAGEKLMKDQRDDKKDNCISHRLPDEKLQNSSMY
jgi:hypothetical protein